MNNDTICNEESKALSGTGLAKSRDIKRALFTGSYPAMQLSTFEQRATSCRLHQDQVEEEQVSTYEAHAFARNTTVNQIYGLNNVKLKVVGR